MRLAVPIGVVSPVVGSALCVLLTAPPGLLAQADALQEGQRIVNRALERAAWIDEQDFEAEYRYTMQRHVRRYQSDGSIRSEDTRQFEVLPIEGVPFRRLVERNGEPLSDSERAAEWEREQGFIEDLKKKNENDEDDDEIEFSADLVSRFQFRLEGIDEVNGRPAYRISFQPRPGSLPVRRQLDRALNKARGEMWVDRELYEIARVKFELMEKVKVWWGLLGSISDAHGELERHPIAPDVWLPARLHTYVHTRVVFSSSRREETTEWREYRRVEGEVQ